MGKLFLRMGKAIMAFNEACKNKWNKLLLKLMFKPKKEAN